MLNVKKELSVNDMISELEEYYECAGFANFYDNVLSKMNEQQIKDYYHKTFEVDEDQELANWERKYNGEEV